MNKKTAKANSTVAKSKTKSKSETKSKRAGASRVTWAKKHDSALTDSTASKKKPTSSEKKVTNSSEKTTKAATKKHDNSTDKKAKSTKKTGTKSGSKPKRKSAARAAGAKQKLATIKVSNNGANNGEQSPRVLAIDIGGTKVKMLLAGELEPRKALSGKEFTPMKLLEVVNELASDWEYDAVTIGFPGLVGPNGPLAEPGNLGPGWVGFDFAGAFQCPVKILNDAAMQAVGCYEGGRMLFVGLGTGFGSTLIVDHVILDVELSELRWNSRRSIGELLSKKTIKKIGIGKWRSAVYDVVLSLMRALLADYVVVGGGNAKLLSRLPNGVRVGHNQTAFRGGFRVWGVENVSSEDLELHGHWKIL